MTRIEYWREIFRSPQFISENNTLVRYFWPSLLFVNLIQQLRKLIFEVILKTCASKITKQFALPLQQLIFKIIFLENEENALIMLKILNEYGKTFHTSFPTDLKSFINQWKNLRYELLDRSLNPTNQSLFKTSALPLCREQTVEAAAMEVYIQYMCVRWPFLFRHWNLVFQWYYFSLPWTILQFLFSNLFHSKLDRKKWPYVITFSKFCILIKNF